MNSMNQWNEFAKEMNDFITRNYEVTTKFWKTAFEQNQPLVTKNIETYFTHMNQNVALINNLWTNCVKHKEDVQTVYTEHMKELYNNFQTLYNETVKPYTTETHDRPKSKNQNA
jgi:hypothetical protein